MTTMLDSHLRLYFLSLLSLFFIFPSSFSKIVLIDHDLGLVACHPHQIQTFTQFKSEFDTRGCKHGDNSNGVWCDNSTGEITKIQLNGCLIGTLKPNSSLFKLRHLRYLNLSQNNFLSSSLPSKFGNLNRLEVLSLFSNGFLGQVPSSFKNLSFLSFLDLSKNDLTGSFPHVWNLSKLSVLELSYNHLSGTLSTNSGLFELRHLRYLNLGSNNFSSSFPSEFGNLNGLEIFSLSTNDIFGQVPPTISNLTRLRKMYLAENKLIGSFPPVQNLTKLTFLELSRNSFSGTIPPTLLTMPFLSYLSIIENHLTGYFEVPNSSTSSSLETLLLGANHFEGQILEPISKLINLKNLDISFLNTRYPIKLSLFSSFESLLQLDLSGNSISPASFSSDSYILVTVRELFLENCGISEFPKILKTLKNLEDIEMSNNKIKGKIPEWVWSLPHLSTVSLNDNSFNGFEGSEQALVNSSLMVLAISGNNFEGALPSLPLSLNLIYASRNNFTGEIPLSICNRSSLNVIHLSYNNFTGPIPQCLSSFEFVDLRKNNLEGSIPDAFFIGSSLQRLDIGFNRIIGKLPRSLQNCSSLMFLNVENNNIEDTFPFWLKALPNLQILTLRSNKFYGPISPPHQGALGFPKLRILEVADNKFNGSLSPGYFANWRASSVTTIEDGGLYMVYDQIISGAHYQATNSMDLQYKGIKMEQAQVFNSYSALDFSGNLLQGNIPESIGFLKALIALNLSNNAFTGHIPLSLANLKELESLDMSRNQLSGTIPHGLRSLSFLAFINVSHNQLNGEIPQGTQITGQPESSFEGNTGLCGLPLKESCFESSALTIQQCKQEDEDDEEEVLNWNGVAIGYGFGVLFGLAITQVIVSYKPEWLAKIICLNKHINH